MITFFIHIQERLDGGVAIDVETPASNATAQEVKVGVSIKKLIAEFEIPNH